MHCGYGCKQVGLEVESWYIRIQVDGCEFESDWFRLT